MIAALLVVAAMLTSPPPATRPAADADWKQQVLSTAGADVWPEVTRLKFTFNATFPDGRSVSRSHDWDLTTGIDTVTTDGKSISINVWNADDLATAEEQAAFQAWTNDSYWLLMPLKLDDPGVNFGPVVMTRDMPPSRANVTMTFDDVGLTPGDAYDLSIDLNRGVIDAWTYRPNPERAIHFTWDDYQDFNGLYLSTNHVSDNGGPTITFTDIEVER